jgi:6-phosphogluconolactonase (cycloisomerase 2 family)
MQIKNSVRAAAAAVVAIGVGIVAAGGTASADQNRHDDHRGQALFLETDAASGNQVLSYQRGGDGTISFAGSYATGGDGATATGATADPLASQGGLTLINDNTELVATNPGSNSVTVFAVDGSRLTFLQQIGSQGQFPASVASYGDWVSVLNAGGAGSVAQFRLRGHFLDPGSVQVRSLGLSNTNPPDFHHGAGEVAYTPNGQDLIIATKLSTNAYDVFSVGHHGELGTTPVVTAANNALPFAFTFDSAGNVVAAEASNSSVSTYAVNGNGTLTSLGTVSDGGIALCWISGANGYFYGSNSGSSTVSSFDENGAGAPQLVNATAATGHAGTTDSVVSPDGKYFYVESGGAGTIDAFAIGTDGSLTQIESVYNLPKASEGIAVS